MKIRKNIILQVMLIIIQLSFTRTQESDIKQNSPIVTGIFKASDSYGVLNQEIDNLIIHVNDFTNSTIDAMKLNPPNQETKNRPPAGFNPPSSSEDPLKNLENEILKVKEMIKAMENVTDNNDTNDRLSSLETALENLQKLFDDTNRKKMAEKDNSKNFLDRLTATVNNLKSEVERMKKHFNEKQRLEMPKFLRSEIIDDIKGRDFDNALRKLQNFTGGLQKNINIIVGEVYDGQLGNFNKIIQFGDTCSSWNVQASLLVYKALFYEMETNSHRDHHKILKMIHSVQLKIIDVNSTSVNELKEAENLNNKLHDIVKDIIIAELIDAMKVNYKAVSKIFENIHENYPPLFSDVLEATAVELIKTGDIEKFMKFFRDYADNYADRSITAYSIVFHKMKTQGLLNQTAIVTLAFGLKKALEHKLDRETRETAIRVKIYLPNSVKNVAFANRVCIVNPYYDEYLQAAFKFYGSYKRWMVTWNERREEFPGYWIIEPYKDVYRVKNTLYNEYLFAASDKDAWDPQRRNVLTSILDQIPNDQLNWMFEPCDDEIYIKNTYFNEYLYADFNNHISDDADKSKLQVKKRHVFTWREKTKTFDSFWRIDNCDNK